MCKLSINGQDIATLPIPGSSSRESMNRLLTSIDPFQTKHSPAALVRARIDLHQEFQPNLAY